MSTWIDFKDLRSRLDFAAVLQHFNVSVPPGKRQFTGYCPIPTHQGKRNSPSFSANLEKGIFNCFGCLAKGNVLDFAAYMSGVDPEDHKALRPVALEIARTFGLLGGTAKSAPPSKKAPPPPEPDAPANLPLDFELKGLDPDHPTHLRKVTETR